MLLISQDFYTSDFICDIELPRLLAREAMGSATILPVFVSPADDQFEVAFEDGNGVTRRVRLANYRTWRTATATRWRVDPLPRLALDRDMQKALVTRHLGELVRLIRRETTGAFDATVRLLDEGRDGSWVALLQRLRADDRKDAPKRRSRTL